MKRSNPVMQEPEIEKRTRQQDSLPSDPVFNPLQANDLVEDMDIAQPAPLSFYHYQPGTKLDDVLVNEVLAQLFMESGEAISLAHESPLKNNTCLSFLKAAENGNLSRVKELWDALYHSTQITKLYFNQLKDDAILAANMNGHMNVIRFLDQGLNAILLDREPTNEEKQQVRDGYRLFAIIDKNHICIKTQTKSALTEATIAFRNRYGQYETRTIKIDENKSRQRDKKYPNDGITKILTNINNNYLEEIKTAKKQFRTISEITLDSGVFIGQIKALLQEWGGYTTGLIYNRITITEKKHYKAIMNAYDQGNLKLFYYWLATDKRFSWFCNFNRYLNLDLLPDNLELDALRYLFTLHAQHGHLARVKIMLENCPALLDSRTLNIALFFAVKNNQLDMIDYLPLQKDMLIWHEQANGQLTNYCLLDYIQKKTKNFTHEDLQQTLGTFKKKDVEFFQTLRSFILQGWDRYANENFNHIFWVTDHHPWIPLIEFIFKDPDFNPDFHSSPMPDAGLQLAVQINNLDLFKTLTLTYKTRGSTLQKYHEQAQTCGSKEMQLLTFLTSQEWQGFREFTEDMTKSWFGSFKDLAQDVKDNNHESLMYRLSYSIVTGKQLNFLTNPQDKYHFAFHNINLLLTNPDFCKDSRSPKKWRGLISAICNHGVIKFAPTDNTPLKTLYDEIIFKINLWALEDNFYLFCNLRMQLNVGPFLWSRIPEEITPLIMSFAIELARIDYTPPLQPSQRPFAQQQGFQRFTLFPPVRTQQAEVREVEEMDVEGPRH